MLMARRELVGVERVWVTVPTGIWLDYRLGDLMIFLFQFLARAICCKWIKCHLFLDSWTDPAVGLDGGSSHAGRFGGRMVDRDSGEMFNS